MSKIQVYCGVSLDGFIAGPDDDLSWLEAPDVDSIDDPGTVSFAAFMEQTGALLMGRRTFDVVQGFGGEWPYGSTPVLVATTRLLQDAPTTVSACSGSIEELSEQARAVAGDKDVYLDGGNLITQALDADCIDELILTFVPVLLGQGVPVYSGARMHRFSLEYLGRLGSMMQIKLTRP